MNLQNYSFGRLYKNLTIKEIQSQCSQLRGAEEICNNPDNWRSYVYEKYGRKYLAERGDLVTADDWMDFARGMEKGYTFRYTAYMVEYSKLGQITEGTHNEVNHLIEQRTYNILAKFSLNGTFLRPTQTVHHVAEVDVLREIGDESSYRIFSSLALLVEWLLEYLQLMAATTQDMSTLRATETYLRINGEDIDPDHYLPSVYDRDRNTFDVRGFILAYVTANDVLEERHEFDFFFDQSRIFIIWYPALKADL